MENKQELKVLATSYIFRYIGFIIYIISLILGIYEYYVSYFIGTAITIICFIWSMIYEIKFIWKVMK